MWNSESITDLENLSVVLALSVRLIALSNFVDHNKQIRKDNNVAEALDMLKKCGFLLFSSMDIYLKWATGVRFIIIFLRGSEVYGSPAFVWLYT